MNRDEIMTFFPHRGRMLLLDSLELTGEDSAEGAYAVRGDEWFLDGHFPGNPVMPGVIQMEILAQAASVLMREALKGKTPMYAAMNNVRFRRQVKPGERIDFECTPLREVGPFCFAKVCGSVDGSVCMEGEFSFALMK